MDKATIFYQIQIMTNGKKHNFIQCHNDRQSAIESGKIIIQREYGIGDVTYVRELSGLEKRVLRAGYNPLEFNSNNKMLDLVGGL